MQLVPRALITVALLAAQVQPVLAGTSSPAEHCDRHAAAPEPVMAVAHVHGEDAPVSTHDSQDPAADCSHCPATQCAEHRACMAGFAPLAEPAPVAFQCPAGPGGASTLPVKLHSTTTRPPTRPPLPGA